METPHDVINEDNLKRMNGIDVNGIRHNWIKIICPKVDS